MIERLLPSGAVAVEAREDPVDAELLGQERYAIERAVDKRRREFTTGRACARAALAKLGLPPAAIPVGERGAPVWPDGVVGSITHCAGYRACALARSSELATVGIDAEPHTALRAGLLSSIARPEELPAICALRREAPDVHWDKLWFSAKESVYKAWFPLARRWLGFEDAVLELDPRAGSFAVRLLVDGPSLRGRPLRELSGRWLVEDGIVLTAIALPRR